MRIFFALLLTLPPKHLSSLNCWNRLEEAVAMEQRKIQVPLNINNGSWNPYLCHSFSQIHFLVIEKWTGVRNTGSGTRLPESESWLLGLPA